MSIIPPGKTIGIIGGGQLGRMTALAAAELGYRVHIYCDQPESPASFVAEKTTIAAYTDELALRRFAKAVDVITFEFENIPHESIKLLQKYTLVRPGWNALHITQNRLREKNFIRSLGLETADYAPIQNLKDLKHNVEALGPKCILKTTELGYDGKGQWVIDKKTDLEALWKQAGGKELILEKFVSFEKEISVILARDPEGGSIPYIPVENIHKNGILDTTLAPADIEDDIVEHAWDIAHLLADNLGLEGMLAVEMFLTKKGQLIINELAPRPHNSGHWTIDACITSQFELLIRAICNLPLSSTDHFCYAIMKNLIGHDVKQWKNFLEDPNNKLHLYGKNEARDGRKMGHVTHLITEESDEVVFENDKK